MEILSHRANAATARDGSLGWEECFQRGWGVEVDVRDRNGEVVVSHSPCADGSTPPRLDELYAAWARSSTRPTVALNVKAAELHTLLDVAIPSNWFWFDHAVPDLTEQLKAGLRCYARASDVEPELVRLDGVAGVWVDALKGSYPEREKILDWLSAGYQVAFVSPELHGRAHQAAWAQWREFADNSAVSLCTKFPEEASEYFRSRR